MVHRLFPRKGIGWNLIEKSLKDYRQNDVDWKRGRSPMYAFYASKDLLRASMNAYNLYFTENALGSKAYPSLVRLEKEVVAMTAEILRRFGRRCRTTCRRWRTEWRGCASG